MQQLGMSLSTTSINYQHIVMIIIYDLSIRCWSDNTTFYSDDVTKVL